MTTPKQKAAATRLRNRQEIAESMQQQREERQKKIDETKDSLAPITFRTVADELVEFVTCQGVEFFRHQYQSAYRNNLLNGKSITIALPDYQRQYYTVIMREGDTALATQFRQIVDREEAFKFASDCMRGNIE